MSDERRMVKRMETVRNCTVDELVGWCIERDISTRSVTITAAHLKYESPQTDEERERAEMWQADHDRRVEQWEREAYDRLKEKYG